MRTKAGQSPGQTAFMGFETLIHLKKSKRFLDVNHNDHAHLHAVFTFVRGLLAPAAHTQDKYGTGDLSLQVWPCGWHILGEHCSQHGSKGT